MIQTLYDTGTDNQVTSKMDGGCYQTATRDCVVGGVGDEFSLNNVGLNLTFLQGSEAIIGGGFFKVMTDTTITLEANLNGAIVCAEIDTTQENGERGLFVVKNESELSKQNINGSGTKRDLPLFKVNTTSSSVVLVSDLRYVVNRMFRVFSGTTEPDNSLGENGDLYLKVVS